MQKLVPKSSQNVREYLRMHFCESQGFINVMIIDLYSKIVTAFHANGVFHFF